MFTHTHAVALIRGLTQLNLDAFCCFSNLMRILGLSIPKKMWHLFTGSSETHLAGTLLIYLSRVQSRVSDASQMSRHNCETKREICFKLSTDDAKEMK